MSDSEKQKLFNKLSLIAAELTELGKSSGLPHNSSTKCFIDDAVVGLVQAKISLTHTE